jgi:hypothetical protein
VSAQPTPGPWKAIGSKFVNDFAVLDATGKHVIAECFSDIRSQGENAMHEAAANARVMAASWAMLAVLQKLRRGDLHQRVRPLYDEAQAAIAAATGERP